MDLDFFEKSVLSLADFPGRVGIMGGEPTLHPQFRELISLFRELVPERRRRQFWTSGHKWDEYKDVIQATFDEDLINYNDHMSGQGSHHPLLIAADDVMDDKELMWELIENCWVQEQWSASINPKGGFFCEIAAARDYLMDGPGGWPIEPGWWRRGIPEYREQMEWACTKCSAALPMAGQSDLRGGRDGEPRENISRTNLVFLEIAKSPRVRRGSFVEHDDAYGLEQVHEHAPDWNPSHFRPFVAHNPEDVERELAKEESG
jgi:hypothetical protein